MLKFENKFVVGDYVRAYDFQPMRGRGECYLEGTVVRVATQNECPEYKAYVVKCEVDVFDGVEENRKRDREVLVPMETSNDYDHRLFKL